MNKLTRRQALARLVSAGAATAMSGMGARAENISQTDRALAFAGKHVPLPLPFNPAKLNGISEKLVRSHHQNNYSGAVKALNLVEQKLAALMTDKDAPAYLYGDLKRQELIRTGSVVLHEKYFANLGGNGKADGTALRTLKEWWGSYEAWEEEFKRTGNALGGGSGWVIFGFNFHTREFHNYWSADHTANSPYTAPLLVLDMYEHAYHMDFGAAATAYVDAFIRNVNWDAVNRRIEMSAKLI